MKRFLALVLVLVIGISCLYGLKEVIDVSLDETLEKMSSSDHYPLSTYRTDREQ